MERRQNLVPFTNMVPCITSDRCLPRGCGVRNPRLDSAGPLRAQRCLSLVVCATLAVAPPVARGQVRIKDITSVQGVRTNQLTGTGLVFGLNGTGGTSPITRQFAQNFLQKFGLRAHPDARLRIAQDTRQRTDNLSVVTVTAELPTSMRPGQKIDVTVAAFDDASSLMGGQLALTPLFGVDGCVYAVAAGPISIGGFAFSGDAASVQKNHPTTGIIPNGGNIEKRVPSDFAALGSVQLLLNEPDFVTSDRIAESINRAFPGVATPVDQAAVKVLLLPQHYLEPVTFLSRVQELAVTPDAVARVVINERTGTVVAGSRVHISPVAITHANLSVITSETPEVSQPAPFSEGVTTVVPRTQLDVVEQKSSLHVLPQITTVGDLAEAMNALGVSPRDLSAIFQQLNAAGALHAELKLE